MTSHIRLAILAALAAPLSATIFAPAAFAAPVYVGTEGADVAVSGFDPVSYFSGTGEPVMGNEAIAIEYEGAVYHFASDENAARFKADPAAFAPQFGGHCAWAMGRGYLAPADPQQYAVVDGKLYLNYDADVKVMWDKDRAGFITSGHRNWKDVPADAKFGDGR